MLPVVAGTRHVSLGGALSNNIHGKNCYKNGAIGEHVKSFKLLKASGEIVECSRTSNRDLFYHVIGGQGLLGVIVSVKLYLESLMSYEMENYFLKTASLNQTVEEILQRKEDYDYCIANVDLYSTKKGYGRSKLAFSRFANNGKKNIYKHDIDPGIVQNVIREGIKYFSPPFMNSFWIEMVYRLSHALSAGTNLKRSSFSQCHFPMDNILPFYNEMFLNGFYEYQVIFPQDIAIKGFECMSEIQREFKSKSLMTSMKCYREQEEEFKNSFSSVNGLSQTYDIPKESDSSHYQKMFYKMNDEVIKRGGKVYLGKTSCIRRDQLFHMYPEMESLLSLKREVDPENFFSSHFYERVIQEKSSLSSLNF